MTLANLLSNFLNKKDEGIDEYIDVNEKLDIDEDEDEHVHGDDTLKFPEDHEIIHINDIFWIVKKHWFDNFIDGFIKWINSGDFSNQDLVEIYAPLLYLQSSWEVILEHIANKDLEAFVHLANSITHYPEMNYGLKRIFKDVKEKLKELYDIEKDDENSINLWENYIPKTPRTLADKIERLFYDMN